MFKAYDWSTEVAQGHTISSNDFFTFYYMLTGVHLFHVLLGLLILGVVARTAQPATSPNVHGSIRGHLLAHGRAALDRHLRPALRDEVSQLTSTAARTITYAWIILSAITTLSWWLAPGHARGAAAVASAPITVAVTLWDSSRDA